jgi:hypothetical protein
MNTPEPTATPTQEKSERPNVSSVWKSFVFHKDKCFFVSTIERIFDLYCGETRGLETMVWDYDWPTARRGDLLHQAGGVVDHQQICRCLIAEGLFPNEDDERTKRFCTP